MSILRFTGNSQMTKRRSPYDIAVDNGFSGTEAEYEKSIHASVLEVMTTQKTFVKDMSRMDYQDIPMTIKVVNLKGTLSITHDGNNTDIKFVHLVSGVETTVDSISMSITADTFNAEYSLRVYYSADVESITLTSVLGTSTYIQTLGYTNETKILNYLGAFKSAPTPLTLGRYILAGDAYLNIDDTDANYMKILVYSVSAPNWVQINNYDLDASSKSEICGKAQKDVLSRVEAGTMTMTDYGYFNNVIADIVTARFLGSKEIELIDDLPNNTKGRIYGGDVDLTQNQGERVGNRGFIQDSDGFFETSRAVIKNAKILDQMDFTNASIIHPCFTTVPGHSITKSAYNLPSKAYWNEGDVDFSGLTANALTSVSSSFYGNYTINRICRCTDSSTMIYPVPAHHYPSYALYSDNKNANITGSYTIPETGRYFIGAVHFGTNWAQFSDDGSVYIYINGSHVQTRGNYNANNGVKGEYYDVHKGDIVTFYADIATGGSSNDNGTLYVFSENVSFNSIGITSTGLWWEDTSYNWHRLGSSYIASGTRLYVQSYWDSNSNIYYANLLPVLTSYMSDLNAGYYVVSGTVNYNGTTIYAGSIYKQSASYGELHCAVNDVHYVFGLGSGYYYNISGSIQILSSSEGLQVKAIYPDKDEERDLGMNGQKFRDVFCKIVHESSARKKKTNIEPFTSNALDIINSVQISSFNFKSDMDKPEDERQGYIGFIADDTDERLSGIHHDEFISMNCIGVLMKAVQELSAEIEELKKK